MNFSIKANNEFSLSSIFSPKLSHATDIIQAAIFIFGNNKNIYKYKREM